MGAEVLANKQAVVDEIKTKVGDSESVVVVEYRGLAVSQMTELRRQLRAEGVELKIYKNTLFKRALEGSDYEGLAEDLVGPNAVAFGSDAVAPSKVLAAFAKKNKALVLKAGIVNGKVVNDAELKELATLPNHDGMISMLLGMFQSPVRSFAYVLNQVAEQKEANGGETPVVAEEAAVEETVVEEPKTEETVEETVEETAEVAAE